MSRLVSVAVAAVLISLPFFAVIASEQENDGSSEWQSLHSVVSFRGVRVKAQPPAASDEEPAADSDQAAVPPPEPAVTAPVEAEDAAPEPPEDAPAEQPATPPEQWPPTLRPQE